MSEEGKRRPKRQFTEEFKREAVALYERMGGSKAAAELDLSAAQIRQWRNRFNPDQSAPQSGQKTYAELEKENRRLNKEIGYLKEINKVLKKCVNGAMASKGDQKTEAKASISAMVRI